MPRKSVIRFLFSRVKWPGLVPLILAIVINVPDWQSRIQFWLKAAKMMGGSVAFAATIVGSWWFTLSLVVGGVGYLALVGEPRKYVQRHPAWPILGWIVFGGIALIVWSVLLAGYVFVQVHLDSQRFLTQEQVTAMLPVLKGRPCKVDMVWSKNHESAFYAAQFMQLFRESQWQILFREEVPPQTDPLNEPVGLHVGGKDAACSQVLKDALTKAGLLWGITQSSVSPNAAILIVGEKP